MEKTLSKKEELFCVLYSMSRDARGAAAHAGYRVSPQKAAARLLCRKDIIRRVEQLCLDRGATPQEVAEGLRRLAFAPCADAIRLMLFGEGMAHGDIENLDLYNVAEIKRPKGGGLEIKFFDRLKALERLASLTGARADGASDLLRALSEGAACISQGNE